MKPFCTAVGMALLVLTAGRADAQPVTADQASDGDRAIARQFTLKGIEALERRGLCRR